MTKWTVWSEGWSVAISYNFLTSFYTLNDTLRHQGQASSSLVSIQWLGLRGMAIGPCLLTIWTPSCQRRNCGALKSPNTIQDIITL